MKPELSVKNDDDDGGGGDDDNDGDDDYKTLTKKSYWNRWTHPLLPTLFLLVDFGLFEVFIMKYYFPQIQWNPDMTICQGSSKIISLY